MSMNRRSLLRGLFAAPAIVAIGSIMPVKVIEHFASVVPKLWGDGIHDDSAALQYLIDNAVGGMVRLPSGIFRVSNTLHVGRGLAWENLV